MVNINEILKGVRKPMWTDMEDKQLRQLEKEVKQLKAENQSFGNVLAIIHGDGGHYITKHGHEKASQDAIAKISKVRDERDKYKAALEILARLGNGKELGNSDGNFIAQDALR